MCSCLRQSFALPKKLYISNISSSSKFFSGLSTLQDKPISNYGTNKLFLKNPSKPKQIQYRYFSLNNINSFFESIRTSEAAKFVVNALIGAHDFTGVSWTVTIIAATTVMKFLVAVPCGIYQQHLMKRLELIKGQVEVIAKKLRKDIELKAIKGQWTQSKFESQFKIEVKQVEKALMVKNNCHPFKLNILFLVQLPFWLLLTIAIKSLAVDAIYRNVSQMENPVTAFQFQVGGPFWCPNLALPDRTLILPTINALSMLTVTEVALLSRTKEQIAQSSKSILASRIIPIFLRLLAVAFFFISAASPSGVSLFWASSSLFSLGQNLLLQSPRVKRFLRIPKTASDIDKPYSHIYKSFMQKWQKFSFWKK